MMHWESKRATFFRFFLADFRTFLSLWFAMSCLSICYHDLVFVFLLRLLRRRTLDKVWLQLELDELDVTEVGWVVVVVVDDDDDIVVIFPLLCTQNLLCRTPKKSDLICASFFFSSWSSLSLINQWLFLIFLSLLFSLFRCSGLSIRKSLFQEASYLGTWKILQCKLPFIHSFHDICERTDGWMRKLTAQASSECEARDDRESPDSSISFSDIFDREERLNFLQCEFPFQTKLIVFIFSRILTETTRTMQ